MKYPLRSVFFSAVFLASTVLSRAGVSYDSYDESPAFTFDTRLVDGLQGAAVSVSFTFDTRGATAPPLQITGVLRDWAGVPVVGATIQIKRAGAIFWQGVSGAGGTFTTPNLSGVNYTVIVTKPGYVTSITNITGTAGGSLALNLQSAAMPAALATQDVFRGLAPGALGTLAPGAFQVFDGTNFVSVLIHPPDPGRDTLVLTHGWNSDPNQWAKLMATLVKARLGTQTPNIVTWDWHTEAAGIWPTIDKAIPQGLLLGPELHLWLGTGYNHHVHFIGHSLGTIVNKYACDYVHGMLDRGNPTAHWDNALTMPHATLLDEAEAGSVVGTNVPWNSAQSWLASNSFGLISRPADTGEPYLKSPIPRSAKWIDNYISAWGLRHSEAVNVWLLQPISGSDAWISLGTFSIYAHSYAWQWYNSTISPIGTPPTVGFNSSKWIAPVFPPPSPANDTLLFENLATADPVDLTSDPSVVYALGLSPGLASIPIASVLPVAVGNAEAAVGQKVLTGYQTSMKWVDTTSTAIVQKVGDVTMDVGQKIGLGLDAAIDFEWDVLNSVNQDLQFVSPLTAAALKMILKTRPSASPLMAQGLTAYATTSAAAAASAGQPAYAWITVPVPSDAGMMAFDFTVTGDPVEDKIACAINDQNVFTLSAKFAPDGKPVSTDMIDVSSYAGQNIELFFGLAGGTSTSCQVAIDGLRFITVPTPKVAVGVTAGIASVKWPAAASGWTLESSETLALGSWQTVPTVTGLTLDSGVATLQESVSSPKKFYRLRRNP